MVLKYQEMVTPLPRLFDQFCLVILGGEDLAVDGFTSGPDRVKVVLQTCFSRLDSLCYWYLEALIRSTLSLSSLFLPILPLPVILIVLLTCH